MDAAVLIESWVATEALESTEAMDSFMESNDSLLG